MSSFSSKLRVKDWAKEDRPREKILLKGIHSLSDSELLAILIGSGNREETVVELAQRILQSAENNLSQLGKFSVNHLVSNFKGIGEAKAISIVAAMELGKRRKASERVNQNKIISSRDIYNFFYPLLCDLHHEEFWALFLNRSNKIIDRIRVSQGGVSETVVDCKLILKETIMRLASGIALCHNHPSGNPRPSRQDDWITQKIKDACKVFDVSVLDHLILCDGSFYSYADEGRLL